MPKPIDISKTNISKEKAEQIADAMVRNAI